MVSQNKLRQHERKTISEKKKKFTTTADLIKCLKQIK